MSGETSQVDPETIQNRLIDELVDNGDIQKGKDYLQQRQRSFYRSFLKAWL